MQRFLTLYAVSIAAFLALDLVWLGVVASGFYSEQMGSLLRPEVAWGPAVLFYLLFVAGVVVFVTLPALAENSRRGVLWRGAFFGLVCYATFDLTSLALIRDFPIAVVWVDLAWGMVLTSVVGLAGFAVGTRQSRA
jgi:uncharacterized membrane protein